jgi:signal peptidase
MTITMPCPVCAVRRRRPGHALRHLRVLRHANRVLSWLGIVMVALLVGMLVFVALAPRTLGWKFVVVAGGSMEPTLHYDSVAVMDDVDPASVKPGDVVMFNDPAKPGRTVTHRVVAVSEDGASLTTKGDANNVADQVAVPRANVRGKYMFSVPAAGAFVHWMGTREGYLSIILVPGMLIIAIELFSIARNLNRVRQKPASDPPDYNTEL